MQINLTWNCGVCVEIVFLCVLCAFLPSLTTLEWIYQQFAKTKMGYISLPSILNGIIGITSYYRVILKIMILLDVIKAIKNKVFPFSLKKEQNLVSLKKKKIFLNQKNRWVVFFLKRNGFFSILTHTQSNWWWRDFFQMERWKSRVSVPGIEECENYWHLNT